MTLVHLHCCCPPYCFLSMLSFMLSEGLCVFLECSSPRNSHESHPPFNSWFFSNDITSFLTTLSKKALLSLCPLLLLYFVHNTLLFDMFTLFCFLSSPFECKFCESKNLISFVHCFIFSAQKSAWHRVVILQ